MLPAQFEDILLEHDAFYGLKGLIAQLGAINFAAQFFQFRFNDSLF
jgi:hypothetical protein